MCLLFAFLLHTFILFSRCFFPFWMYAWTILFTQFYDMKKNERGKKNERTFDIYSFLFIFIISFSLNSFNWTEKIMWKQEIPNKLLWILRKIQSFSVKTATKCSTAGGLGNIKWNTTLVSSLQYTKYNDNKLHCERHVETLSLSLEIFSIFITRKAKDRYKNNPSFFSTHGRESFSWSDVT